MSESGQFALLGQRRFYPLFWTQMGGAFNDNLYKSALLMLFTYGDVQRWGLSVDVLNNLVAAALIIPFLLFAPAAGQRADRCDKAAFIRLLKRVELAVMLFAAFALWLKSSALLFLVILATGTQSACFSPLKYAILPQHLGQRSLTGANGLIHTGTSFAVFIGLLAGTVAMQWPGGGAWVAATGLAVAALGWWVSRRIPAAPPERTAPAADTGPFRAMGQVLGCARENPVVFWCVIGISWYWFLGSVYLTQLPNFARTVLGGGPAVVSCLLILFLAGIGLGALACEKLSRRRVEPALVPLGAILVAIVGLDLAMAGRAFVAAYPPLAGDALRPVGELWTLPAFWRVAADVALLGAAGGLYTVPLQAQMQASARPERRARIVAANNVINALFMMAAALFGMLMLGLAGVSIPVFFALTAIAHLVMMALLLWRQPLFIRRFAERWLGAGP